MDGRIEELFTRANLPEDGRALWRARLAVDSERVKQVFIDTFAEDLEMLTFFTDDLRRRIAAGNDPEKLAAVLDEERKYFTGVLSNSQTE
jgi:hypothetical protein